MRTRWVVAGGLGLAWWAYRPFRAAVEGDSMVPTLSPGDYLVAVRNAVLRRGDVVVVRPPGYSVEMVKRVIGLPGDEVTLKEGRVQVGDRTLDEPYALGSGPDGEWRLGPEEYVVLGDNRDRSTDGRAFGPLAREAVLGRVVFRYWPQVGRVR